MIHDDLSNLGGGLGGIGRLGLDVVSMLVLVGWLYRRRVAAPEMTLVFTALNIGLFAAVSSIGSGDFPTGIGLRSVRPPEPGAAAQRRLHAEAGPSPTRRGPRARPG